MMLVIEIGIIRMMMLRNESQVHWSGFSSVSCSREVALSFAGPSGVLLRIRVQSQGSKARDLHLLSVITLEREVRSHAQLSVYAANFVFCH